MLSHELAVAFMLLTAPPGFNEPPPEPARWPAIQAAVQQLAIEWELLDPRETRYILAKPDEFGMDINLLRRRHAEFLTAPRLREAARLPDRHFAADMLQFNRAFRKTLDQRRMLETDRLDDWLDVIRETDKLHAIWDAIRDARCEFYYVTVRRGALRKLKELLGEEAWEAAMLPPSVPTWRFAGE